MLEQMIYNSMTKCAAVDTTVTRDRTKSRERQKTKAQGRMVSDYEQASAARHGRKKMVASHSAGIKERGRRRQQASIGNRRAKHRAAVHNVAGKVDKVSKGLGGMVRRAGNYAVKKLVR